MAGDADTETHQPIKTPLWQTEAPQSSRAAAAFRGTGAEIFVRVAKNPSCARFFTMATSAIAYGEKDPSQNAAKVTFKMELFFFLLDPPEGG